MNSTDQIAYLDCFSGVSGDMLLSALVHAGLPVEKLKQELAKLNLKSYQFNISHDKEQSLACCRLEITQESEQPFRTLPDILDLLENSELGRADIDRATAVFTTLAKAEAAIHAIELDKVHFHEIGAIDTIIDVVGVVVALRLLGISRVYCSALPLGRGFVECDHGRLPLPAPAVCELLKGVPSYGVAIEKELVTPTGAALVKTLVDEFGPLPPMRLQASGHGAGTMKLPNKQPNLLRVLIGTAEQVVEEQLVTIMETHLDDWNPEGFPHLCERLLEYGALDMSLIPCQGKKGRPGYVLQVIGPVHQQSTLQDIILTETSAIGLRFRKEQRRTLTRAQIHVATPWGKIAAKKIQTPSGEVIYPEYEECRTVAKEQNLPLPQVYRAVMNGKITDE